MSKPMLVTWPFVMLLLDYWPLDERVQPSEPSTFNAQLFGLAGGENAVLCPGGGGECRDLRGAEAGRRIDDG